MSKPRASSVLPGSGRPLAASAMPENAAPPSVPGLRPFARVAIFIVFLASITGFLALPDLFRFYNFHPWPFPIACVLALSLVHGGWRRRVRSLVWRVRFPSNATRLKTAVVVGVLAAAYLFFTAYHQGYSFGFLRMTDEHSYMIQMRMLAHGRLWYPPVPKIFRDALDSFHILTEPKYASIYFPGTALLYLPGLLLHIPWWVQTVFTVGAAIGLLYLLISELFDGMMGIVAVLMALGVSELRGASLMLISQVPMLLMGLLLSLLYLRWRRDRSLLGALLIGIVSGWAGITRPADALCVCIPIGLAILLDLRGQGLRRSAVAIGILVVGAFPFLALQAVQNIGITGKLTEFPSDYYVARQYPAPMLGFHKVDPARMPHSRVPEKRAAMRDHIFPVYEKHRGSNPWPASRCFATVFGTLPCGLLLAFVPLAPFTLWPHRARWMVAASFLLYLAFYTFYVFYYGHYLFVMVPAAIVLVLSGVEAAASAAGGPGSVSRQMAYAFLTLLVALLSIWSLREFNPWAKDAFEVSQLERVEKGVQMKITDRPAVLLVRFVDGSDRDGQPINPLPSPVYNTENAWPLDAEVLRLHDLGDREDAAIFDYFARTQPDRVFYRYDRAAYTVTRLGVARDLARHPQVGFGAHHPFIR